MVAAVFPHSSSSTFDRDGTRLAIRNFKMFSCSAILLIVAAMACTVAAFPQNDFVFDGPTDRPDDLPLTGGRTRRPPAPIPTTRTTTTTTTTTDDSVASLRAFDRCVTSCPTTQEYNPVCGSDNVDYNNPGSLGCAQFCGKAISMKYYGKCSSASTRG